MRDGQLIRTPLLVLLCAALYGCGGGGGNDPDASDATDGSGDVATDAPTGDTGIDTGPELNRCTDNLDCRGGEVCRQSYCRQACEDDSECAGSFGVCSPALGYCVQCVELGDCPLNRACVANTCVFFCRSDDACLDGQACNAATGDCVDRDCARDADCAGGFRCDGIRCVPIDALVCDPGQQRCAGNTAVVCSRDGTREDRTPCGDGQRCSVDGDGDVACRALVCEPSATGCLDTATAFVCDNTGTVREDIACGVGRYCADGSCREQSCSPNARRCVDPETVGVCDAAGRDESAIACASEERCADAQFGCACVNAECVARACTPGTRRCVGPGYQECRTDGASFGELQTCPMGTSCNGGSCQ